MVVGRVRQVVILCSVNATKILLGRTCEWSLWRDGRFIEVVFKTGSTVLFPVLVLVSVFLTL